MTFEIQLYPYTLWAVSKFSAQLEYLNGSVVRKFIHLSSVLNIE